MDKNAIKKYAIWARRELISRVSQRAAQYDITADGYEDQNAASVHGRILNNNERKQRSALIDKIKEKGYEQVMEETAYTWFNRFSALRFMEVNGYLPTRVRVFTDDENNFKPQILTEAINMELEGLDMQKVYDLKNANDDDALFKYMIIVQCNALSKILPGMFQRISDYTELLFPDNLLREGSVVEQMIAMIPQEDWTDQVQIIGWLYQYYNSEPKDQVYANLKKNIKISKENIPAATQLFTPDWIVRYMVENSLGRLWLEGHPNDELKAGWKYYLDEAEQEPEVQAQLAEIRKEYAALKPEDILTIDPCQGSGHILAYMFDVLVQIYEAYGYSAREAASSIVEHNIWGLDIDERAAQLAYFSVMMKARQYDRRFFSRGIQPHVYAIQESNNLDPHCIEYFVDGRKELKSAMDTLVKELHDAKEYGSILNVTQVDFDALYSRFEEIQNETTPGLYSYHAIDTLLPFVQVAHAMAQKYHAVATNPPYMGSSNGNAKLTNYIKKEYSNYKADMYAVFMKKCISLSYKAGFIGMVTMQTWMFLASFKKVRQDILNANIISLIQIGYNSFPELNSKVAQAVSFILRPYYLHDYNSIFFDLSQKYSQSYDKETAFFNEKVNKGQYFRKVDKFARIDNSPLVYWMSNEMLNLFDGGRLGEIAEPRIGLATGCNDLYLRLWFEVDYFKIGFGYSRANAKVSGLKWFPYNKGGEFRRWYGNQDYIIDWQNDGNTLQTKLDPTGKRIWAHNFNLDYIFKPHIAWSYITTSALAFRAYEEGFIFDSAGTAAFTSEDNYYKVLGYLNSKVANTIAGYLDPTMHFTPGEFSTMPYIEFDNPDIVNLIKECVELSREEWNSYETSWNYMAHPLINGADSISNAFSHWEKKANNRYELLKENEERINKFFIDFYGLTGEIDPAVSDKNIALHKADMARDIRSFIAYAVGCMFGRYSLDSSGVVYSGGTWNPQCYKSFIPDKDNIIPICDDEYFEDDIVGLFIKFMIVVFGEKTLEANLRFVADALGGEGAPREIIRRYFLNDFYRDHCATYSFGTAGKRPIYWLFDSGKENGFKCLIYMHRYQPDTIARIRTDYVHEQQSRYRTVIADLESRVANAGTGERVKLTKHLDSIRAQAEELRVYEEKIHHLADQMIRIDLDDGVKVNYAKFQDVLAKIK